MKKTLLLSNIVGDITKDNNEIVDFNNYAKKYLAKNIPLNSKLLFINAPGLGGEDNYLTNILKCFARIGVGFSEILDLSANTPDDALEKFDKASGETIYFLMGGNPLAQMEIIKKFNLFDTIKNYEWLVIGFCEGAINLSKYSIITTDDDFDRPQSYEGIGRVPIVVEPHYTNDNDTVRNEEINSFAKELNEKIYAIPDASVIIVENNSMQELGKIYHFA